MIHPRHYTSTLPTKAQVLAEYKDPLNYMDPQSRQQLRSRCIRFALILILVGSALLAAYIFASGASGTHGRGRWGSGDGVYAGFGLIIYGIFRLCTLKRSMTKLRKEELVDRYWDIV